MGNQTKAKVRDAFGLDAIKIGGKRVRVLRRCEGGVLTTLPEAGTVYDSGDGCIKGKDNINGRRTDKRRPDHVTQGFFVNSGPSTRKIPTDGVVHIVAWDGLEDFGDNQGHYRIIITLTRNDAVKPQDPVQ